MYSKDNNDTGGERHDQTLENFRSRLGRDKEVETEISNRTLLKLQEFPYEISTCPYYLHEQVTLNRKYNKIIHNFQTNQKSFSLLSWIDIII